MRAIHSIMRDNIGSLLRLKSGSTTLNYSFDAWGRRRDADTWSYTLTGEPPLMASRGYTGHEHIEEFGLTNMNGRLYDPIVGRFLSADNYVQNPANSQNYNRYSYCLNNPLKYNDPSGNIFQWVLTYFVASHVAGVVEAVANNWDWSKADPTLSGTRANNFWRLSGGLFSYDTQRGGDNRALANIWEVASRFTPWQMASTIGGYNISNFKNTFQEVEAIKSFHGTTVMFMNMKYSKSRGGITMGNYITMQDDDYKSGLEYSEQFGMESNLLLLHEYGHYRQARQLGPLVIPMSVNSVFSALGWASVDHDRTWWEMDANARSFDYLEGYLDPTESNNWLTSWYGRRMAYGGYKWQRYLPFYFAPSGLGQHFSIWYNVHYSN